MTLDFIVVVKRWDNKAKLTIRRTLRRKNEKPKQPIRRSYQTHVWSDVVVAAVATLVAEQSVRGSQSATSGVAVANATGMYSDEEHGVSVQTRLEVVVGAVVWNCVDVQVVNAVQTRF
jgi:hypothetical protein